jgi:hypothetical protein
MRRSVLHDLTPFAERRKFQLNTVGWLANFLFRADLPVPVPIFIEDLR